MVDGGPGIGTGFGDEDKLAVGAFGRIEGIFIGKNEFGDLITGRIDDEFS